jgi:hypothetical protein
MRRFTCKCSRQRYRGIIKGRCWPTFYGRIGLRTSTCSFGPLLTRLSLLMRRHEMPALKNTWRPSWRAPMDQRPSRRLSTNVWAPLSARAGGVAGLGTDSIHAIRASAPGIARQRRSNKHTARSSHASCSHTARGYVDARRTNCGYGELPVPRSVGQWCCSAYEPREGGRPAIHYNARAMR